MGMIYWYYIMEVYAVQLTPGKGIHLKSVMVEWICQNLPAESVACPKESLCHRKRDASKKKTGRGKPPMPGLCLPLDQAA
jgi:hypothetical protein